MTNIIDDDICADCAHCCLLRPLSHTTDTPALCVRGWPRNRMLWNVWSQCPAYEKKIIPIVCSTTHC